MTDSQDSGFVSQASQELIIDNEVDGSQELQPVEVGGSQELQPNHAVDSQKLLPELSTVQAGVDKEAQLESKMYKKKVMRKRQYSETEDSSDEEKQTLIESTFRDHFLKTFLTTKGANLPAEVNSFDKLKERLKVSIFSMTSVSYTVCTKNLSKEAEKIFIDNLINFYREQKTIQGEEMFSSLSIRKVFVLFQSCSKKVDQIFNEILNST